MQPAKTFYDLIVWQKAHALVLQVYKQTALWPREELYGLISQVRRAAVSVPANIVEGFKKRGVKDKRRMLNIAQGSLEECRYYFKLAFDLSFEKNKILSEQLEEVSRLLNAYIYHIPIS